MRFAPRATASWHAAWRAVRRPPTTKLSTSSTIAMKTACRAKIGSRVGRRRGPIHHRRAALRQAQDARPIDGAGAPPGREFSDAVAGNHGACRPRRAERCPRRQGLGAAQDLPGAVRKQVCRCGFPHEATRILPQHAGRHGEDGLGLRAARDQVKHGGMLIALPGAEYRHEVRHHHPAVRTSATGRVTTLARELTIRVDPATWDSKP